MIMEQKLVMGSTGELPSERLIIVNDVYGIASRERNLIHIQKIRN